MRTQAELAMREQSPEKMNESLQQLVLGSQRATRLVNQLLSLARAESAENPTLRLSDDIDLNILAEQQTLGWVDEALKKNIDLGFERAPTRSEEHTSELQSLMRISYAVFCLTKKTRQIKHINTLTNRTYQL